MTDHLGGTVRFMRRWTAGPYQHMEFEVELEFDSNGNEYETLKRCMDAGRDARQLAIDGSDPRKVASGSD